MLLRIWCTTQVRICMRIDSMDRFIKYLRLSKHAINYFPLLFVSDHYSSRKSVSGRKPNSFQVLSKMNFIASADMTENLCKRFRQYLQNWCNGYTPANYYSRLKWAINIIWLSRNRLVKTCFRYTLCWRRVKTLCGLLCIASKNISISVRTPLCKQNVGRMATSSNHVSMNRSTPHQKNATGTTHVSMMQRTDWLIPMISDFLDSDLNEKPSAF